VLDAEKLVASSAAVLLLDLEADVWLLPPLVADLLLLFGELRSLYRKCTGFSCSLFSPVGLVGL
jgi:hypothetical protein